MMPAWKRIAIWALRLVVGGVFVMSGLVKMIDLWGFVFKIEEYLAVWQMVQPRTIVFMAALFISGYEFVLGALLMMGCYKRSASWGLLLMMFVMLPLTLYLWMADPVSDCGCFGEFLKLSNAATFWKNVAITAGLALLSVWNFRLKEALFNPAIQWIVVAWLSLYALLVGLYGYNVQPMIDFRSFPEGTSLLQTDEDVDEGDFVFVYEKDGKQKEFDIDSLPDSTWTFVDRVSLGSDKKGGASHLAFFDGDEDVTATEIDGEGMEILLVVSEPKRVGIRFSYIINEIKEYADSIGVRMIALLGTDRQGVEQWISNSMAEYVCYSADDTQLKELVRGNVGVVLLENGVIKSKNMLSWLDHDKIESPTSREEFLSEIGKTQDKILFYNLFFGGVLLMFYMFQGIILAIRAKIKRAYRKKQAKI